MRPIGLIVVLEDRVTHLRGLIESYEVVLAQLRAEMKVARKAAKKEKGVKATVGISASAVFTLSPPEIKVRVRAPEGGWNGSSPIPAVMVAENAVRDAAFFLFGRRTGPGYAITLKPAQLVEEADGQWIQTRVYVVPKNEPRDRLAKHVAGACDRARQSLVKAGTVVGEIPAPETSKAQEVTAG